MADDVLQQLQRRGVRPVEVVEDHEQGVRGGLGPEHLGDALEQEVPLDTGSAGLARASGTICSSSGRRSERWPRSPATRRRASGEIVRRAVRIASTIGSKGTTASGRGATPQHDGALAVDVGREAGGQPGLADAGLADEQGEVTLAGDDAVPDPAQGGELPSRPTKSPLAARSAGPGRGTGDGSAAGAGS